MGFKVFKYIFTGILVAAMKIARAAAVITREIAFCATNVNTMNATVSTIFTRGSRRCTALLPGKN